MEKITLEQFWESEEKLAILCDTEKKEKTLLKEFEKMGKKWCCSLSYLGENCYKHHKTTVFLNNKTFGFNGCEESKLYEFEDIIFID